jgi:hypothetical protein
VQWLIKTGNIHSSLKGTLIGVEASLPMPQGVTDPLGNLWANARQHAALEGGLSSRILPYRHPLNTIPFQFDSPETDR